MSQLQAVAEGVCINECHSPFRDFCRERQNLRLLGGESTLYTLEFVLAAATLGEFNVVYCRNSPRVNLSEAKFCPDMAACEPD